MIHFRIRSLVLNHGSTASLIAMLMLAHNVTSFPTATAAQSSGRGGAQRPYIQIAHADIENDRILVTLGPLGLPDGILDVVALRDDTLFEPIFSGAMSPGRNHEVSFNAAHLPPGSYSEVAATWRAASDTAVVNFDVLGVWRHSRYNTPVEDRCTLRPVLAYLTTASCDWTETSLKGDFVRQSWINGSGITSAHGPEQNEHVCFGTPTQPSDARRRSFRLQPIKPASHGALDNSTVAQGNERPFPWGARILIVGVGVKTVTDLCAACRDKKQLDNYTTKAACAPGAIVDLGQFQTIYLK